MQARIADDEPFPAPPEAHRILPDEYLGRIAANHINSTNSNVRPTSDIARRVVPILLDHGVEHLLLRRPEGREFLNIRNHIPQNQADFFRALGDLLRFWRGAGQSAIGVFCGEGALSARAPSGVELVSCLPVRPRKHTKSCWIESVSKAPIVPVPVLRQRAESDKFANVVSKLPGRVSQKV